jgi:hypothetical protein
MNAETQHLMHKVRSNYSSCTCRSSENICRSSGGAREKGKRGSKPPMKLNLTQKWCILKANVHFFAGLLFESHPVLDQTQGSGAVFS